MTVKPERYWVFSTHAWNERGFKSIVEARKFAIKKLNGNGSYVTEYGHLLIVLAREEPHDYYPGSYRLVGVISKTPIPGVYDYTEYESDYYGRRKRIGTKKVSEKGTILRR